MYRFKSRLFAWKYVNARMPSSLEGERASLSMLLCHLTKALNIRIRKKSVKTNLNKKSLVIIFKRMLLIDYNMYKITK